MRWAPLGTFASFANRNYLLLWVGMMCLMGGLPMQAIAQAYLIFEMTDSARLLGLVSGVSAILTLLLLLWGGAIADRLDRKRIILAAQGLNGAIALVVAVVIATGLVHWTHLLAASILRAGAWSFMMPALLAIIPEIVGQRNLTNGLALYAAGVSAATIVSPAMAGFLLGFVWPEAVYFAVAALSFLAMAYTSMVSYDRSNAVRADVPMADTKLEAGPRGSVAAEIIQGLTYTLSKELVRLLLVVGFVFIFLSAPVGSLLSSLIVEVHGLESVALDLSEVGALAGAVLIARLQEGGRGKLFVGAGALTGVVMVAAGLIPIYGLVASVTAAAGLGIAVVWTLGQILIMGQVEDRYRGRVISIFMMNSGLMLLAVLLAKTIADLLGPQLLLAGLGVLIVLYSAFVPKRLWNLR